MPYSASRLLSLHVRIMPGAWLCEALPENLSEMHTRSGVATTWCCTHRASCSVNRWMGIRPLTKSSAARSHGGTESGSRRRWGWSRAIVALMLVASRKSAPPRLP